MLKRFCSINLILLCWLISVGAQRDNREYDLKAAFIYNFTKYIEWENTTFSNEFVIGVIGASPIYESLAEIAEMKTMNGKKIIIRKCIALAPIDSCQILFIPHDVPYPLDQILAKVPIKGTLIVSEKSGFAAEGTALNFIIINNNLKFEANKKAIESAGLKASSQLLKLAIIISNN